MSTAYAIDGIRKQWFRRNGRTRGIYPIWALLTPVAVLRELQSFAGTCMREVPKYILKYLSTEVSKYRNTDNGKLGMRRIGRQRRRASDSRGGLEVRLPRLGLWDVISF